MANYQDRVLENIQGLFFVDRSCIDCDTCREIAPMVFADATSTSKVFHQPETTEELLSASQALLSCPTGSIGTVEKIDLKGAVASMPILLEDNIYYNGYASEDSFGASSYFLRHREGNWMIDSPRYQPSLIKAFEAMGGVRYIFLSHRDDIADSDRYAKHFGAERIIHQADSRVVPDAEYIIDGSEPISFGDDLMIIPTPGHTRGSCVLLYNDVLFSGDHVWYSRNRRTINAGRSVCWYSWPQQIKSMELLLNYSIRVIYPGHGERYISDIKTINDSLRQLIERMNREM